MADNSIIRAARLMAEQGLTIAFAESATAGWLCSEFALTPDSGEVLKGGITCYDASLKVNILKVPQDLIDTYTPESMEVTQAMARCLSQLVDADIYVAVTGLTTPGGSETPEKPVGTMFIHALVKGRPTGSRLVFEGSCEEIIHRTVTATAELLITALK